MSEQHVKLRQPPVFYLSFFSGMFERFGFYVLSFLLVLYMKSEYGFSDTVAFALFGVFNGLVYLTPAIGGYIADNIIGIRRCIIIGLALEGLGMLLLAVPEQIFFWIGLALIVIGVGLFKTAPTDLMARAYHDGDPRIDSGFTLYYMSINIGSMTSSILAGIMQRYFGWSVAFLVSGIALYLGLACFFVLRWTARNVDAAPGYKKIPMKTWAYTALGLAIGVVFCVFLVSHVVFADVFFVLATCVLFVYFFYEILKTHKEERLRIIACLILIVMGFVFYVLYFQLYTSMVLFVKRNVLHTVLGVHIPTVVFLGFNPFWILVLSPILAALYNYLNKHGKDLAVTTKFPLGVMLISFCFLFLKFGTFFANADAQISGWWIILALFLYSLGELLIAALGVAMITHIAPRRLYGVMMGAWFLIGCALAASVSGIFASLSSVPVTLLPDHFATLNIYGKAFFEMGLMGLGMTVLAFIVSPYVKRMANLGDSE